jgi:RimJ/RimL family protein N-acetyltransferase
MSDFVPPGFVLPEPPATELVRLEPLLPGHNERDLAAWASSLDHIHATPGYEGYPWPPAEPFTLERNLEDLEMHERDFAARRGFTYTVLEPAGDVVGCVYVYPSEDHWHDVHVRSWVRASRPELDVVLWRLVSDWLAAAWPFERVLYAPR